MDFIHKRYERVESDTELDNISLSPSGTKPRATDLSSQISDDQSLQHGRRNSHYRHHTSRKWLFWPTGWTTTRKFRLFPSPVPDDYAQKQTWKTLHPLRRSTLKWSFWQKSGQTNWKFGLFAGLYASLAVLLANVTLLIYSAFTHDGVIDGMSTIHIGTAGYVRNLSTAYHILFNILGTILLSASNYAMQILCAPTREELDKTHSQGKWMDVGLMSVHNLRHIERKRALLWILLASSSAPLHLFYNSVVLEALSSQDYQVAPIEIESVTSIAKNNQWKALSNSEWRRIYSNEFIPDFGDLLLVIDSMSTKLVILHDWSFTANWSAEEGEYREDACDWKILSLAADVITVNITVNALTSQFEPLINKDIRVTNDTTNPAQVSAQWRDPIEVKVGGRYPREDNATQSSVLSNFVDLCSDDGWLRKPTNARLHVSYAYAKLRPNASKVQIALPFLAVVIAMNLLKVVAILYTIRVVSVHHILTIGDAIATYLHVPETTTMGKCTATYRELMEGRCGSHVYPWDVERKPLMALIGGRRTWTKFYLTASPIVALCSFGALTAATGPSSSWGTNSHTVIKSSMTRYSAQGAIFSAWLANMPQVFLSLVYFSVNRLCTSMCTAREWNNFATQRKGLRVTSPTGPEQRSTHFLQLPYRWAVPLTFTSGVLHWLLSQSLFLVRREVRARDGTVYPDSTCGCGYSASTFLPFAVLFCVFLIVIFVLLGFHIDVRIPAAAHCSLVISAACHPPDCDHEAYLKKVQWGVVEDGTAYTVGHCSFTSQRAKAPRVGCLYA